MAIFERAAGARVDPSRDWGDFKLPIPDFDLGAMCFGGLALGAPLESAAFLGRPDRLRWTEMDYFEMLYAAGGFQVDVEGGRLAYLAFFIGPDEFLPKHKPLAFSRPRLVGAGEGGAELVLSPEVGREQLEELLGPPGSVDADDDETVLYYRRGGVAMEFELAPDGKLKRWNLYPAE